MGPMTCGPNDTQHQNYVCMCVCVSEIKGQLPLVLQS